MIPSVDFVRRSLSALADGSVAGFTAALAEQALPLEPLSDWFIRQGIAPFVYYQIRSDSDDTAVALTKLLEFRMLSVIVRNDLHFESLALILNGLQKEAIPTVLLKGVVLAEAAYGNRAARPMSDIDLWLRDEDMTRVALLLTDLGFKQAVEKEDRPLALQQLSGGEIQFYNPQTRGLVELHWSGFPGWWVQRTAVVDDNAIWQRSQPLELTGLSAEPGDSPPARRLSPEDMVIQLAVHQAISSQFAQRPLGSLLDVALAVRRWPVDWRIIASRAQSWRVGTAVWLVLHLTEALIGLPGVATALNQLKPSPLRRRLLRRFVNPETIVAAADWRQSYGRQLLLLLLVDRPRDMARLTARAVWPEREWLAARYGPAAGRSRHLWQIMRFGEA